MAGYQFCQSTGGRGWRLCMFRDPCPIDPSNVAKVLELLYAVPPTADFQNLPALSDAQGVAGTRDQIAAITSVPATSVDLKVGSEQIAVGGTFSGSSGSAMATTSGAGMLFGGGLNSNGDLNLRVCKFDSGSSSQTSLVTQAIPPEHALLVGVVLGSGKYVVALRFKHYTDSSFRLNMMATQPRSGQMSTPMLHCRT